MTDPEPDICEFIKNYGTHGTSSIIRSLVFRAEFLDKETALELRLLAENLERALVQVREGKLCKCKFEP